jgi:hypothetical protein
MSVKVAVVFDVAAFVGSAAAGNWGAPAAAPTIAIRSL